MFRYSCIYLVSFQNYPQLGTGLFNGSNRDFIRFEDMRYNIKCGCICPGCSRSKQPLVKTPTLLPRPNCQDQVGKRKLLFRRYASLVFISLQLRHLLPPRRQPPGRISSIHHRMRLVHDKLHIIDPVVRHDHHTISLLERIDL
jgi:hypothetical protein